jgi:hypothetical protein
MSQSLEEGCKGLNGTSRPAAVKTSSARAGPGEMRETMGTPRQETVQSEGPERIWDHTSDGRHAMELPSAPPGGFAAESRSSQARRLRGER